MLSGVSQGSVLGLMLFSISINRLKGRIERMFIRFASHIKLRILVNTFKGKIMIHRFKHWAISNRMIFNHDKWKNQMQK